MTSTLASLGRAHEHMVLLGRKTAQEKIATFLLDMASRLAKSDSVDLPMQRTDIADSKIVLAPQRKQRHENASNLSLGRKIHRKMTNDE